MAPGLYWYHAHMHHHAEAQVFGGLSGMIVVEGLQALLPAHLRDAPERLIALRDIQVADGAIKSAGIDPADGTRLVNDLLRPRMTIRPGQTQLWRIANVGANLFYKLRLEGHTFRLVAEDGHPIATSSSLQTLLLAPGKRFEVLVTGAKVGSYDLVTEVFDGGERPSRRVLATLRSTGTPMQREALPTRIADVEDLSGLPVPNSRRRSFTFDTDASGRFLINGKTFSPSRIDTRAQLGTVQEWTLNNGTPDPHPFHLHTYPFQVVSIGFDRFEDENARARQDTVVVPPAGSGSVVIRVPFEDFAGTTVFHCHILAHEDAGMMATLKVEP